jgi:hypothetical protein
MITRRRVLAFTALTSAVGVFARPLRAAEALPEVTRAALVESDLVYITPLKTNGEESRCHAEVWFVHHDADLYVVTSANAWRADAVRRNLVKARLWVGEFGEWQNARERFRSAPGFDATATIEASPDVHARVLDTFGKKYTAEWLVWGPRFKNGLADGSRVLLRYQPNVGA